MLRAVLVLVAAAIAVAALVCTSVPPDAPLITAGRSVGAVDSVYTYTFELSEPDARGKNQYRFDWGTGISVAWTDITDPTQPIEVEHTWHTAGDYDIKVMVRDGKGRESSWSDAMSVHIAPKFPNRAVNRMSIREEAEGCLVLPSGDYALVGSGFVQSGIHLFRVKGLEYDRYIPVADTEREFGMRFAVTPDGRYVYASCSDLSRVVVVRMSDFTVVDSIMLEAEPVDVAVHPDGDKLWVLQWTEEAQLLVFNTSDNPAVTQVDVGDQPSRSVAFTPDGSLAYLTCEDKDVVWVLRTSDYAIVDSIRVPKRPYDISITADGRYAFVLSSWFSDLSRIRLSDNKVLDSTRIGSQGRLVTTLPNGEYAYVPALSESDDSQTAWVVRTADFAVVDSIYLSFDDHPSYGISAAPDGQNLVVALPCETLLQLGF